MSEQLLSYGIATYVSQNILIVPFQADFYKEVVTELRNEVSFKLCNTKNIIGLIIDISQVRLLDLSNMQALEEIFNIASILGVNGYLAGLQPSVALVLVELGYDPPDELKAALNIEQATQLIRQSLKQKVNNKEINSGNSNSTIQEMFTSDIDIKSGIKDERDP